MPIDENIKDAFDNPNLDNQDWLEPSDVVFAGVMDAIDDTPRRRAAWLYWLLGLMFVAVLALIIADLYSNGSKLDEKQEILNEKIQFSGDVQNNKSTDEIINEGNVINSNTPDNISKKIKSKTESQETPSVLSERNSNQEVSNTLSMTSSLSNSLGNNTPVAESSDIKPSAKNGLDANTPLLNTTPNMSYADSDNLSSESQGQSINDISSSDLVIQGESTILISENRDGIDALDILNPIILNDLLYNRQFNLNTSISSIEPVKTSNWFIGFGLGYSIWNFNLNDNYETALNPADFNHQSGRGEFVNLAIGKYFNRGNRLAVNFGYENILLKSGHNSSLVYETIHETNHTNTYDIVMATPLGFITSNIVVERDPSSVITDATDIVIDLHNSHRVKSFNLDLEYSHKLYNVAGLRFYGDFAGGINYIQSVSNRLDQFGVAQNAFMSGQSSVTSTQANINSYRSHLGLGISIEKSLGGQTALRASYLFRRDLTVVHSVNDFSTQVDIHRIGLQLVRNL